MKQQNKKSELRLYDWKLWFRLGTIGFLLLLSSKANGEDSLILFAPPKVEKQADSLEKPAVIKKKVDLVITDKKAGLPVLITPSKKKSDKPKKKMPAVKKNPAAVLPMPVITPQQKSKPAKKKVAKPRKKKVTQAAVETEEWSILITPGVSSHPNMKSKPSIATFQLERKTGKLIAPPVQHVLGFSDEAASEGKSDLGELELIEPNHSVSPVDENLPAITPKKHSVKSGNYQQLYNSIPYSRTEYLANPAYRHEATMELLFGTLRPTVIHKQDKPKRIYNQPRLNEATPRTSPPPMPFGYGGYYGGYYPGYYGGYGGYYRGYIGGYYGGYGYRGGYRPYSSLNTYGHTRYGYRSNRYGNRYSY